MAELAGLAAVGMEPEPQGTEEMAGTVAALHFSVPISVQARKRSGRRARQERQDQVQHREVVGLAERVI